MSEHRVGEVVNQTDGLPLQSHMLGTFDPRTKRLFVCSGRRHDA